jgi:hypothetical protein
MLMCFPRTSGIVLLDFLLSISKLLMFITMVIVLMEMHLVRWWFRSWSVAMVRWL